MFSYCRSLGIGVGTLAVFLTARTSSLDAQTPTQSPPASRDTAKLGAVQVTATRGDQTRLTVLQSLTLPAIATITSAQADVTVNAVDPEDAVKYLPSLFLRKRNYGDTGATLESRVWGVSSSARTMVFADGVPLTALVANNNTVGMPRWGLVPPDEIARIDVMYGPFSAAYSGNSMGAVMQITTRQPDSLEASIQQTGALQRFSLYGTDQTFGTSRTSAAVGDRFGKFSFWAGGDYENSNSQPLTYVTSATFPNGTTGGFSAANKLGASADVLGASGILHTGMTNANLKLAYDFSPALLATYTFALWHNGAIAGVDSYLAQPGAAQQTFAGQSGFASGYYTLVENHTANSFSVRSDTKRDWDFEAVVSDYDFGKDQQRSPSTASSTADTFDTPGKVAVLDGTGWYTGDVKGAWHQGGMLATHIVTFGAHVDRYALFNPTYNASDWRSGSLGTISTQGQGKTRTEALWVQDAWTVAPTLRFTVGGRYEWWRAFDGLNVSGSTTVVQPEITSSKFSPKAVLTWGASPQWTVTGSVAKAYRFATPAELYQLVSTGVTFTSPDPNLKPDNDLSAELRVQHSFDRGSAQLALFQDDVHDAIISQFLPLVANSPTLFSYLSNVDHVRARGIEAAAGGGDVFVRGLDLSANATYVDARTLALSGRASATAPAGSAVGKFLPNIPKWRAAFVSTYHFSPSASLSLNGRYATKMFTTLDDADVNTNTYQGFSEWFVMDARAGYRVSPHWFTSIGVDNLLNRKYFLFHPFPQRTLVASLKYSL